MEPFWNFIDPPDDSLFYKRSEIGDKRFGEIVGSKRETFDDRWKVVILGFPYDEGAARNRGRAGASLAPTEIRKAFYKLTTTKDIALADVELPIFDAGNVKSSLKLEEALKLLQEAVAEILKAGRIPVVLGGSNDLSYADFHACHDVFGRCGAINIDSHLDVRDYSRGINSGTPYRMLLDEKILRGKDFVEYGTQDFSNSREHLAFIKDNGATIFSLADIHSRSGPVPFEEVYNVAGESSSHVYVSFDMDAVRSPDAPGVSAPTPTGLSAEELLACSFSAGAETRTAMIDICEVNPTFDIDGRTAKLAAMVAANFIAGVSNRK